jgi:hypothetical protein
MKNEAANQAKLDELLAAYRDACVAPEPSVNFMPELWARIDNSRTWSRQLWKWANSLVAAAALASLFFVMLQMMPRAGGAFASATYLEALADENDDDALAELAMTARPGAAQEQPSK